MLFFEKLQNQSAKQKKSSRDTFSDPPYPSSECHVLFEWPVIAEGGEGCSRFGQMTKISELEWQGWISETPVR